jgi:2-oxoglutarate dehydrogenase E2 component (dihydrolipoamide succinyltransferase)
MAMAIEIKVPSVGESVKEGMIGSWRKASGDKVERDEVLLDLETDKATVEVVAEASGQLEIIASVGQVVKIGEVIGRISESSQGATKSSDQGKAKDLETSSKPDNIPLENGPAVRRLAQESGVNVSEVSGTGKDGRVTKGDLISHAEKKKGGNAQEIPPPPPPVNLGSSSKSVTKGTEFSTAISSQREDTRKPMSMMRRRIAERLVHSQNTAAILTTFNELDMTAILDLRKKYAEKFLERHGIKLGFMGFFVKAAADALQAFPEINATLDGNDVIYHNYCDFSVAVSTEKGLLTPVIRNCDKLSITGVELAIAAMSKKARDNKISLDDLTGGTFTISNGGIFGSLMSTPIINPPQTAILGMHKTMQRPVVMPDGKIEARPMMYLALSYDHRMVDGKEAVQFLVRIKDNLEDPARLLLGV